MREIIFRHRHDWFSDSQKLAEWIISFPRPTASLKL